MKPDMRRTAKLVGRAALHGLHVGAGLQDDLKEGAVDSGAAWTS